MVVYNNLADLPLCLSLSLSFCVLGSFILLMLYMLCPVLWVVGTISYSVKLPECVVDHLPYSSAEVKNGESYISTPPVWYDMIYLTAIGLTPGGSSMPLWCAQGQLYLLLLMQLWFGLFVCLLLQPLQLVCSLFWDLRVLFTNLIHTSTIAQPSFWQKKGFTISTIGLMTEHGILLGELLEVIFCIAFSWNLYIYMCVCVCVCVCARACVCVCVCVCVRIILNSAGVGKVQYMFCNVRCNGW